METLAVKDTITAKWQQAYELPDQLWFYSLLYNHPTLDRTSL